MSPTENFVAYLTLRLLLLDSTVRRMGPTMRNDQYALLQHMKTERRPTPCLLKASAVAGHRRLPDAPPPLLRTYPAAPPPEHLGLLPCSFRSGELAADARRPCAAGLRRGGRAAAWQSELARLLPYSARPCRARPPYAALPWVYHGRCRCHRRRRRRARR